MKALRRVKINNNKNNDKKVAIIEYFLCVIYFSKHFTCAKSFEPHSKSIEQIILLTAHF